MEKLILSNLGQWSLVKNWTDNHIGQVEEWADSGMRQHLKGLPAATGQLRQRMLNDMHSLKEHPAVKLQHRINADTGESEFKLYRAIKDNSDPYKRKTGLTSWSTHPSFAAEWSKHLGDNPQVLEAWIPEKHIHSYLPTVQVEHGHEKNEGEVLVNQHKFNISNAHTGEGIPNFSRI
jgi:hypothetical protein